MTCRPTLDCESCKMRDGSLCTAIRARATSVLPLLPERDMLLPGIEPTDVSLKGGRFGVLRTGLLMRCGAETGMDLVSPGEALGEAFRGHREMRVSAVVPSEVCWFDVHDVEAAALRDDRLRRALHQASEVAVGTRRTFRAIRALLHPVERLAAFLVVVAGRLAERDGLGALKLSLECRAEDMATLLGLLPATLDEARQTLVERQIIETHGPAVVELVDVAALEDLTGMDLPPISAGMLAPAGRMQGPAPAHA